jgi:hypothetical protein
MKTTKIKKDIFDYIEIFDINKRHHSYWGDINPSVAYKKDIINDNYLEKRIYNRRHEPI